MNKLEAEKILQEFHKRTLVKSFLQQNYRFSENNRMKRGEVHDHIASSLKLPRSNALIKEIKACLMAMGVIEITIQGAKFYKHLDIA